MHGPPIEVGKQKQLLIDTIEALIIRIGVAGLVYYNCTPLKMVQEII